MFYVVQVVMIFKMKIKRVQYKTNIWCRTAGNECTERVYCLGNTVLKVVERFLPAEGAGEALSEGEGHYFNEC